MKLSRTFRHSKVARRIVYLFISCALLPVTILAAVSFYEVSAQLQEQSHRQLVAASKSQGMSIYERLDLLDDDLQVLSARIAEHGSLEMGRTQQGHFISLAAFSIDGTPVAHWGKAIPFPRLNEEQVRHLLSGNPLLLISNSEDGTASASMLRATADNTGELILAGQPDPHYLWRTETLPVGLEFCVLTKSRALLFCSDDRVRPTGKDSLPLLTHSTGLFQWKNNGAEYDTSYWRMLTKPIFGEDFFTIVVSQEHGSVLAPMLRFRRMFILVVLLSLWIVLLASMVQIRRTLGPLKKLQQGTQKIGAGKFNDRVEVASGDEFESLACSFNQMASQLGRQFNTLKTIHGIDQAIFASLDREAIVDGVLAHMPSLLSSDVFGICIFDESRVSAWARFRDAATGRVQTKSVKVTATDWLHLSNNPEYLTFTGEIRIPEYLAPLREDGVCSFLVLPIRVDNTLHAVLTCAQKDQRLPAEEELRDARQVADQLAVALSHVRLIAALEQQQWGTMTALARAIDAKSQWTAGHSERVTHLALEIGRRMGLSNKDLRIMHMGGLLHDIGKIGTPPVILDKPDKLTADEMRVMRDHVRTGVRILEPIPGFHEALPIVSQHHEWFNGMGYPQGLAGDEISLYARIFAVADCYDALTSDRPYRKGLPVATTLDMIRQKSGVQFDPAVIQVFTEMKTGTAHETEAIAAASGVVQ